ncbi:MAG: DNA repair protein RecO [Phycisphaerales bacterium]
MVREDALVLRLWDFSETSQTAALFTRGHGAVRCLAKGSKRPKAKFSGGLELATLGEAVLIVKPTADLAQLIEWDLRETYFGLRRSVDAHLAAMCALDVIYHAVRDHDPHPGLFDAATDALRAIDEAGAGDAGLAGCVEAVGRLLYATLKEAGYEPVLDRDVVGGGSLGDGATVGFSTRHGGLTADPGPSGNTGNAGRTEEVWRVRRETVDSIRWLGSRDEYGPAPGVEALQRSVRLLGAWLGVVLGDAPAAQVAFLERLTPHSKGISDRP